MRDPAVYQSRILIVDDEEQVIELLCKLLREVGYEMLESTTDARAALELFDRFQPDLVVLDWRMPDLSGREVLAQLRAAIPEETPVPILVVTADPTIATRRDALHCGASDFVAKPYDNVEILARIGNLLQTQLRGRREAAEARRESEERFAAAFEHAPIGVALVAPDGRWLKVNRALCDLVGFSEQEMLARDFQSISSPGDLVAGAEHIRRLLSGESRFFQVEQQYVHAAGHLVAVQLNVSLVRAPDDRPKYFIMHVQDISERRRAEESLRLSEERFRGTFEQAAVGMAHVSTEGRFLRVNEMFCRSLAIRGRNCSPWVLPI